MHLKQKINIGLLIGIFSIPYVFLGHGFYTNKFDAVETVVVAQGTIVSKNVESYYGGKSSTGHNSYIMVVNDNGYNKTQNVTREVYYNNAVGNPITLVETVTYGDKHHWFPALFVISMAFLTGCIVVLIIFLINKYIKWVNE